mgnify:CR=1 FL=1
MSNYLYLIWIPLLPLASFVLLGLFGRKYFTKSAGIIGTASLLAATALSFIAANQYFFVDGKINGVYQKIIALKYTWLEFSPNVAIDMGIIVDPISVMMLVVVTSVSLMVHLFSLGYMKGEERFATYYAFLSLFTFSMLGLVLSSNIFQVYMFWELVGVSSFLLISYYFNKPAAVAASKKAFIVTRFADLGFLIGILILGFYGGTMDIGLLIQNLTSANSPAFINITTASFLGASILTWGLTLIFVGGAGKSAMFPLHIWLPDAMEGPTPVSALIHAATMVVAGVYLVARLFPIFSMDELVEAFTVERISKSGAKFDAAKTKWFNQQYLRSKSNADLADIFLVELKEKGFSTDKNYVEQVCSLVKEKAQFSNEFWSLVILMRMARLRVLWLFLH